MATRRTAITLSRVSDFRRVAHPAPPRPQEAPGQEVGDDGPVGRDEYEGYGSSPERKCGGYDHEARGLVQDHGFESSEAEQADNKR
jgi:hypothetical protein